jgi:hypothetical protein
MVHYAHEIVVPIARPVTSAVRVPEARRPATAPQVQRSFSPGSAWLSTKLYCGESIADEILTEVIGPLTHQLLEDGAAKGWFFIRYGDPALHLRWRLVGDPAALSATARPAVEAVAARLLDEGKIWRVQFDTYQREIERYGGPEAILLAERLFQADSDAVFRIMELGGSWRRGAGREMAPCRSRHGPAPGRSWLRSCRSERVCQAVD